MWRRILAYLFFVLGLLTTTFFKHYTGELIPYPFLFWIVGLAMFGIGLLFLYSASRKKERSEKKQHQQTADMLKQHGERIRVDFELCKVIDRYHAGRVNDAVKDKSLVAEIFETETGLKPFLPGNNKRHEGFVNQSVIVFVNEDLRTGIKEKFVSRLIEKDKVTLMAYMLQQQYTWLYVDKANRNIYYFDLEFLNHS